MINIEEMDLSVFKVGSQPMMSTRVMQLLCSWKVATSIIKNLLESSLIVQLTGENFKEMRRLPFTKTEAAKSVQSNVLQAPSSIGTQDSFTVAKRLSKVDQNQTLETSPTSAKLQESFAPHKISN